MIEQNVQVVQCSQERVQVRLGGQSGCATCDAGRGCGAGIFARLLQRKPVVLELARGDLDVDPGQLVTLAIPEKVYLKLVLNYYAWPLVTALLAAFLVNAAIANTQASQVFLDAVLLATALVFGVLVLYVMKRRNTVELLLQSLQLSLCNPAANQGKCGGRVGTPQSN